MNIKAVFPGKYIQGPGVLDNLPELVRLLGRKGLILASPSVKEIIIPLFGGDSIRDQIQVEKFNGECCEDELNRVADIIKKDQIDVIVGMGGGKTIDTAKIAADRAGIPVIIVPTIASTDAPCSGCAVTYTHKGEFEAVHYQKMNPSIVLVDMNIIAAAPVYTFCEKVGLPTTLADIGLLNANKDYLMKAAEKACESGSAIHHEMGKITPQKVLDAMIKADTLGRERKSAI